MRKIRLTRGYAALVDDKDFERVNQFTWYAQGNETAGIYAARRDKQTRKMVYMHRFVLSAPEGVDVDHRETKGKLKLNNRRNNLRFATPSQNGANQKKGENRSSQFKGVSWDRRLKQWLAYIRFNGKKLHLGCFGPDEVLAARAYDSAAIKLFGEFAALNFPTKRRD